MSTYQQNKTNQSAGKDNYQFNPNDWEDLFELKIPDVKWEGSGTRLRVYRKTTDKVPRMSISNYWTDKESQQERRTKEVKINPYQLSEIVEGLKECYQQVNDNIQK